MITRDLRKLLSSRPNQTVFRVLVNPTPNGVSEVRGALEETGKDFQEAQAGNQTVFETKLSRSEINELSGIQQIEQIDHSPTFQPFAVSPTARQRANVDFVTTKETSDMLNVESAWDSANRGDGASVGVIDSPVDADHPAISENVVKQKGPTSPENHGTWVAGCIAASEQTIRDREIRGMAPDCDLYTHGALAGGSASVADIVDAIGWCIDQEVDVLNMSLGGPHSSTLQNATQEAVDNGVVVVASAGNTGPATDSVSCPAHHDHVLAVASTNTQRETSYFSSRGPGFEDILKPDVAAPGGDAEIQGGELAPTEAIYSTGTGDGVYPLLGTSMAAPHVAGMVALGAGVSDE